MKDSVFNNENNFDYKEICSKIPIFASYTHHIAFLTVSVYNDAAILHYLIY